MVDLSFIGKSGLIVDYEGVVSLMGYNVIQFLKKNNVNIDKINKMSDSDILLSYINRNNEDISTWLKNEFDIDFDINNYSDSVYLFRPNLLYTYKVFKTAYDNGIKNLIIHSDIKSDCIKKVEQTYDIPIKCIDGDIIPIIKNNPNVTYICSSPKNVLKCKEVDVPFALVIVDDYMYMADTLINKIPDELIKKGNIYVQYTSIISAGIF